MKKLLMLGLLMTSVNFAYSYEERIECHGDHDGADVRVEVFKWFRTANWDAEVTISDENDFDVERYPFVNPRRGFVNEVWFWGGGFDLRIDVPFGRFFYNFPYQAQLSTRDFNRLDLDCTRYPF